MRRRHVQFDVIDTDLVCLIDKVAVYSFYCCIVAVTGRVAGDGFLQRILRRDDKIDRIEPGYIYKMFHYGQMTDVQRVERPSVNRYVSR